MKYFCLRCGFFICYLSSMYLAIGPNLIPDMKSGVPAIVDELIDPDTLDALLEQELYDEFAKKVGMEDISHLKPYTGAERSLWDLLSNGGNGDIIFTQAQAKVHGFGEPKRRVARQGVKFDDVNYKFWPRTVHYAISKKFKPENRRFIEKTISDLNFRVQNEMFVEWISGQKDYILIVDGSGCSSFIGRNGGPQIVSMSQNGCMTTGSVMHELLHVLGMIHEHTRPDRDSYIHIEDENIPDDWKPQYASYSAEYVVKLGPYDYYSIMHYPVDAPGDPSKNAIEIYDPSVDITKVGQRKEITDIDVGKIKKLYNFSPTNPVNKFQPISSMHFKRK